MKLFLALSMLAILCGQLQAADEKKADAPGAAAGEKPKYDPEKAFKKIDTNSDNSVSLDEFKATKQAQKDLTKAEAAFKRKDKDGDGKLTLDEYKGPAKKEGDKKAETK
jgi:Ca2+-binding EF-hand superfamily protein